MEGIGKLVRLTVAAALLAGLASCSFAVPLNAAFLNGRLGFILAPDARGGGGLCPYSLTIADRQEDIWEFERALDGGDGACEVWLPLIYGEQPSGTHVTIPPRAPRLDRVYVILASQIEAAFRLRRVGDVIRIENVPQEAAETQAALAAARFRRDRRERLEGEAFDRERRNTSEVIFEDAPLPPERR